MAGREAPIDKKLVERQFRLANMYSVYVAGYMSTIPRDFGDNFGTRPIRTGISKVLDDNVTSALNHQTPMCQAGMFFRLWCEGRGNAMILQGAIDSFIIARSIELERPWRGLDPTYQISDLKHALKEEIHDVDIGFEVWEDWALEFEMVARARNAAEEAAAF